MGNDGGSIPTRRELVKEAARNPTASQLKESRNEQQDYLWTVDPLSQKPLSQPVVSDAHGRLFNKDSVIEFLLPTDDAWSTRKAEQEAVVNGAFMSLKDLVEVRFQVDESGSVKPAKGETGRTQKWICPITGQELGPGSKAVYLVPCGHALSGSAVKEISGEHCPQCDQPYASNDVVPILSPNEEDIARLTLRQTTLKENGLTHCLKKASGGTKKRKKGNTEAATAGPARETAEIDVDAKASNGTSVKIHYTPQPNLKGSEGIKDSSTASLTTKVIQEQELRNKRRKMETSDNIDSLFSKHKDDPSSKERDIGFMNRGFAIAGRK